MNAASKLAGLVLAGGASRRMGRDKGSLRYHAEPQAVHAHRLLTEVCGRAYVSTSARNAAVSPYADLPLIVDDEDHHGPASGLKAAWARHLDAAWLTLAVDLPLVDRSLLAALIEARDPTAPATAFRHPDGTLEPLCAIWEPAARAPLLDQLARGDASLRRFLEQHGTAIATTAFADKLLSINDLPGYSEAVRKIAARRRDSGF